MDNICRLCCGTTYVNNPIFNDSSQIYLKMTACLPLKLQVSRDDHLPQKICDDCTLKIDDFYTFSKCAVEVQTRLKEAITAIINGDSSTELVLPVENDDLDDKKCIASIHQLPDPTECLETAMMKEDKYTQTDERDEAPTKNATPAHCATSPSPLQLMTKQEIKLEYNGHAHLNDDLEDDQRYSSYEELDYAPPSVSKHVTTDDIPTDAEMFEQADVQHKRKNKVKKKRDTKDHFDGEFIPRKEKKSKEEKKRLKMIKKEAMDVQVKQEIQDISEAGSLSGLNQFWSLKNTKIKEEFISEAEILYCCVCYEQYIGRTEMTTHYRKHVAENPIEIDNLILEATKAVEIGNTDGELKSHKCQYCNKEFSKLSILALHYITHKDRKPYKCSLCEKTFKDVKQILKHGKSHAYGLADQPPVAECTIKDCPTAEKGELCPDNHLILKFKHVPQPMSKRFACDLCDEGFVYVRYLREHRLAMHPEAQTRALVHRCVECGRQFAHANSLRRHLRSHTGERNFLCNVCGKALSSREHLKFHIRIHEGYKPHICKTCGKGFVKKCNLTLHERVHSGERPHVCPHCGKAFSQRSTLVIHERYHSGARPYVCPLCNKGFVAKGLLSMHAKQTCI